MHEIHPNTLWIGHAFDIRDARLLFDHQITAVVDVAYEETVAQVPRNFVYCRFPLNDGGGNSVSLLRQAILTTTGLLQAGHKTVVACSAGMSRSPTLAAFVLAKHCGFDPSDVIARIGEVKSLELKNELWKDMTEAFRQLVE